MATSAAGTTDGAILSFTTTSTPPAATTQAATAVTTTAATLNASVNPEGSATSVTFVYGTEPTSTTGTTTTTAQSIGSGTSAVAVNAPLTGLDPGTTYYLRGRSRPAPAARPTARSSASPPRRRPVATDAGGHAHHDHHGHAQRQRQPRGQRHHVSFVYGTSPT